MESALVAYSGGIDSAFLLKVAAGALGGQVVALTALSPSFPSYEKDQLVRVAREIGVRHFVVDSGEVEKDDYRANLGNRCYHCKSELYRICRQKASELGLREILNGTHRDDLGDIRPGLKAAHESSVRSPLLEAGLSKEEIRQLARALGLSIWAKPAMACLASRFPVGVEVTPSRLARVDRVESGLAALGFRIFRVRFHEEVARIEVAPEEMARFDECTVREQVRTLCLENGFAQGVLDLGGYRPGGAASSRGAVQIL